MAEIGRDQFKYTACSITNEECGSWSCTDCELAIVEVEAERDARKQAEIEGYTLFERKVWCVGRQVLTNPLNIVAVITPEDLAFFQAKGIVSKQVSGYSTRMLTQYSIPLRLLRIHNKLPIPDQIWVLKDCPGVFRFGDKYYMIAPRVFGSREAVRI